MGTPYLRGLLAACFLLLLVLFGAEVPGSAYLGLAKYLCPPTTANGTVYLKQPCPCGGTTLLPPVFLHFPLLLLHKLIASTEVIQPCVSRFAFHKWPVLCIPALKLTHMHCSSGQRNST